MNLTQILNPPAGLPLLEILAISLILGMMHGATPDEHTWPITFSYAIGKYSTRSGMKAGLLFSAGFTAQRAFLTTIGFLGLAAFYQKYNLDGPVYMVVGFVMAVAGSYVLKGKYLHLPIDTLLRGGRHHSAQPERVPIHEAELKEVPLRMTVVHGLIAGFGFGAYATIITFILAPQVPSVYYAPLPGTFFGIGTMVMQIIFGAIFANIAKAKKLSEEEIRYVGTSTAGRTLYYGGIAFALVGLLILLLPGIDAFAVSTGNPIPNLNTINVGFLLVVGVVGGVGITSIIKSFSEVSKVRRKGQIKT
jgi:ABC-type nickel/cobalt efflux system permease component RcnA